MAATVIVSRYEVVVKSQQIYKICNDIITVSWLHAYSYYAPYKGAIAALWPDWPLTPERLRMQECAMANLILWR